MNHPHVQDGEHAMQVVRQKKREAQQIRVFGILQGPTGLGPFQVT